MKETPRIYNVDRKEEEEDPEAREDSRGEEERWSVEQGIDNHRQSDNEYFDGPTDIDHSDEVQVKPEKDKWKLFVRKHSILFCVECYCIYD